MVAKTLITLSQTRLITIAAVHGAAVAGGAGIMSACDFVVAAERTKIGYPEVRRGLVAGLVMTFLRRQVGERNMRELLFGSELIDAERAREIGLVNRVVAQNDLMNKAQKFADSVLQGAPGALTQTKKLIEELSVELCEGGCRSCAEVSPASARIRRSARRHRRFQRKTKAEVGCVIFPITCADRGCATFYRRAIDRPIKRLDSFRAGRLL